MVSLLLPKKNIFDFFYSLQCEFETQHSGFDWRSKIIWDFGGIVYGIIQGTFGYILIKNIFS